MRFRTVDDKQYHHQSIIKETNIKQVFNLIRENAGISRIGISKITGLSRATVSILVDKLAQVGLVNILGAGDSDTSGRKPIMLEINKDRVQIIVISLQIEHFKYTLFDLKGNEIDAFSQKIVYKKGCAEKIWKVILSKSPRLDISSLAVICVSIPARINHSDKTFNLSILDIQDGCDLLAELRSLRPDIPLVAGNQSTACVYAEYKDTYNGKIDEMIYFNINEGVSAGILLNGRVFTGEIGHMTIDPDGPLCTCGKRGCAESLVSKSAILREFGDLVTGNKKCLLHTLCKGNEANIHYSAVREALDAGDPASLKTADRLAGKIAFCISNVICMFNPEKIIIGGSIKELGQVFLDRIVGKVAVPGAKGLRVEKNMPISYAKTGPDAEARGLFLFFLDKLFTIMTETENMTYLWN